MKTFVINKSKDIVIICDTMRTRNGFKHEARLLKCGFEVDSVKINYLNRTWESFEYESVINKLLDQTQAVGEAKRKSFLAKASGQVRDESKRGMKSISMVMAMGNILAKDQKGRNDWKARMLKAGLEGRGLIMPSDWDELDEATKEARLNAVMAELGKE